MSSRKNVLLLKYIKAGDGTAQRDFKFKIIYTSMFYIPFIGEKKLQENDEELVVLDHHNVKCFCSSSVFLTSLTYKEAFNTTSAK